MTATTIAMALEFAGLVLPIAQDEAGRDVVPLKPITDLFGLDWKSQYRRTQAPGIREYLGVCMGDVPHAGQQREMVCIRVSRVAAYLFSVNPESVRAAGNDAGATYLARKWEEWGDVLHAYEQHVGMFANAGQRSKQVRDMLAVMREKRAVSTAADRAYLTALTQRMAADLGLPHQDELPVEGRTAA